ncbi:S8 family serine peptidase (plasmid) [Mesorhizobium sp. AaZ16]|uniref:S8 family serine peptidase n=1 Tax=Mesorhizobium sp. AaZ16 TaxID=3402289 RepID=UPI00374FD63C
MRIGIWDGGVVAGSHGDFTGRLTVAEPTARVSSHATHVAGTLAGDGSGSLREEIGIVPLVLSSQADAAIDAAATTEELRAQPAAGEETLQEKLRSTLTASPAQWRGVAPGAAIISYFWDQSADDHEAAIRDEQIRLSQNSWGFAVDSARGNCSLYGDYTVDAAAYDRIVRGLFGKPLPIVFAAGNERNDSDCGMSANPPFENYANITPPQTAKNVITVGAINSDDALITEFSSFGPTDDGRLKPDLVAAGCQSGDDQAVTSTVPVNDYDGKCGTSMAAPAVSGAIALLMEARDAASDSSSEKDLHPSSYRALLIHGAQDIEQMGPDYVSGYGRLDIMRSLKLLDDKALTEGEIEETDQKRVAMLDVPPNAKKLKVTLVWDDEPASPNALISLVNDLDLRLVSPVQEPAKPWVLDPSKPKEPATRGLDRINVVEQVEVESPAAGSWLVEIAGFAVPVPPQAFSLMVSIE